MKRSILLAIALAAASVRAIEPAAAQQGQAEESGVLDVYTATVSAAEAAALSQEGVDLVHAEQAGTDVEVDAVLTEAERSRIEARTGVDMQLKRNRRGSPHARPPPRRPPTGSRSGGRGTRPGASATSCTRSPPTIPSS